MAAPTNPDLMQLFQLQTAQITQLLQAVSQLTATQAAQQQQPAQQTPPPAATPLPTFRQYNEREEDWSDYLAQYHELVEAHQITGQTIKHLFLAVVGTPTFVLLQKLFPQSSPRELDYQEIVDALTAHYERKVLVAAARYRFFRLKKTPDQTHQQWITELKGLTRQCKFTCTCGLSYSDVMLRDAITQNIQDQRIRAAILKQPDPSLESVLQLIEAHDTFDLADVEMHSYNVNTVRRNGRLPSSSNSQSSGSDSYQCNSQRNVAHSVNSRQCKNATQRSPQFRNRDSVRNGRQRASQKNVRKSCPQCINRHKRVQCPSRNATCYQCGKRGHVQAVCMQAITSKNYASQNARKVHSVNVIQVVDTNTSVCESVVENSSLSMPTAKLCFKSSHKRHRARKQKKQEKVREIQKDSECNSRVKLVPSDDLNTNAHYPVVSDCSSSVAKEAQSTLSAVDCDSGVASNACAVSDMAVAPSSSSSVDCHACADADAVLAPSIGECGNSQCKSFLRVKFSPRACDSHLDAAQRAPSLDSDSNLKDIDPKVVQSVTSAHMRHSTKQSADSSCSQSTLPVQRREQKLFVSVSIADTEVQFQLDTGSAVTLINKATYERLGSPKLSPSRQVLTAYTGQNIPVLGTCSLPASFQGETRTLAFVVLKAQASQNIFGLDAFDLFGLSIQRNVLQVSSIVPQDKIDALCDKYSDLFSSELGCAKDFVACVKLKDSAVPKFRKARPVPIALRDQVANELKRWQDRGVISPVSGSQWASPLVILRKLSGKLRLCADFKETLNWQTIVDTYPLPRPEELMDKLGQSRYFSKIDLAEAYLQLPLDDESKKFFVINTHKGLFQFQRLPFGSSSAPAIFQRFLEQLTASVPCCSNYLDDIVVSGRTAEEHLANLESLFKVLTEAGLRCNKDKCSFFQTEIEYLGHVINAQGIHPLHSHLSAIKDLPPPKNLHELQAVMGKLNYYFRFIPNASQIAAPLHHLRRKNVPFIWSKECQVAFDKLKSALLSDACLIHFDPEKPVVLAVDASSYGLGAVLSHRIGLVDRPIAFASKLLTQTQQNYSQIEKEALAIIYGVTKFHHYLYGRKFYLLTDHKPLTSLFSPTKPVPPRTAQKLQRWALLLSNYQYEIMYRPTTKHANADTLSRLPVGQDVSFDSSEIACCQIDAIDASAVTDFPLNFRRVAQETAADANLSVVARFVRSGWPARAKDIQQPLVRRYFAQRHALSVNQGVLLLHTDNDQARVIVPHSLQREVLRLLHQGHWGIVRTKQLARRHCTWVGMDTQIENMTSQCTICAEHQAAPPQTFSDWPRPKGPWQRLHIDFAGPFWNTRWLIIVDAFSKFPFVIPMNSTTASSTISALTSVFCIEGLPETIVSDNGPQFVSKEFQQFCRDNDIQHITTAPFHPQSNGEAERFVRTFKSHMDKMKGQHSRQQALQIFLSTYRSMPRDGPSPAELLHGRRHRTLLHLLQPPTHRIGSYGASRFQIDTPVLYRVFSGNRRWMPGTIQRVLGRNMFIVCTSTGSELRRHANQLRLQKLRDPVSRFLSPDPVHRQGPQPHRSPRGSASPGYEIVPMEVDAPPSQSSPPSPPQLPASPRGPSGPSVSPQPRTRTPSQEEDVLFPPGGGVCPTPRLARFPRGSQGGYRGTDGVLDPSSVTTPVPPVTPPPRPSSQRRRRGPQPYATTARRFGGEGCGVAHVQSARHRSSPRAAALGRRGGPRKAAASALYSNCARGHN